MLWSIRSLIGDLRVCRNGVLLFSGLRHVSRRFAISAYDVSISCEKETIFALCSGHGKSGVAVIRLSGPNVPDVSAMISINSL